MPSCWPLSRKISDITKDESIFKNALISAVLGILASIIAFALGLALIAAPFLVLSIIVGLAIIWLILMGSSYFLYRSYKSVALHTGAKLFSTVGLLYLIGSVLAIILIGFLIIFIAGILEIVAFLTFPETFGEAGGLGGTPSQ